MLRVYLGVACLAVSVVGGCSARWAPGGDPASSRLPMGRMVIARGASEGEQVIIFRSAEARPAGPLAEPGLSVVSVGEKMRVVSDEGQPSGADDGNRDVMVYVLEGLQNGVSGTVSRRAIRPLD